MKWIRSRLGTALALVVVLAGVFPAYAADSDEDLVTPPRLSLIDGEVSFWRPGAEDWGPARLNTALASGDALFAAEDAKIELQFGSQRFLRAGGDAELGLDALEPLYIQFRLKNGYASLDIRTLDRGATIEVATPDAAFTIERAGYYKVRVENGRSSFVARRGGYGTISPASANPIRLDSNEEVIVAVGEDLRKRGAPDLDAWDEWNYARTSYIIDRQTAQSLPADIYGVEELDRYGEWRLVPRYGRVWVPASVAVDWVPYSTGRWVFDPYYNWTWVDDAPWGWAPYHYGRWVWADRYWAWAPGPVVTRPIYSPALVAFFDYGPRVSIGISGPSLAWVALGWGEPILPWWGPRIGVAWWGGWGGPCYLNRVVVHHTTVIHAHQVHYYDHVHRPRPAVVVTEVESLRRGRTGYVRGIDSGEIRRLKPVPGRLAVTASPRNLAMAEGEGRRPRPEIQARSVVATRPAYDPTTRLQKAGVESAPLPRRSESRVVERPRQRELSVAPSSEENRQEERRGSERVRPREREVESSSPNRAQPPPVENRVRRAPPDVDREEETAPSHGRLDRQRESPRLRESVEESEPGKPPRAYDLPNRPERIERPAEAPGVQERAIERPRLERPQDSPRSRSMESEAPAPVEAPVVRPSVEERRIEVPVERRQDSPRMRSMDSLPSSRSESSPSGGGGERGGGPLGRPNRQR